MKNTCGKYLWLAILFLFVLSLTESLLSVVFEACWAQNGILCAIGLFFHILAFWGLMNFYDFLIKEVAIASLIHSTFRLYLVIYFVGFIGGLMTQNMSYVGNSISGIVVVYGLLIIHKLNNKKTKKE